MDFSLIWLPLVLAVLNWVAVARKNKRLEYFSKPGTMVAILIWMAAAAPEGAEWGPWIWFAIGIFLSMLGDFFLMLPKDRFIAGLVSFLFAHIAYIIGLNQAPPPFSIPAVILIVLVGMTGGRIFRNISFGLAKNGNLSLQKPVLLYTGVISLMVISGLFTFLRPEWLPSAAWFVSGGAFLFMVSDTLLAWDRFVTPLTQGRLKTMVSYHLAQILLVLGSGIQFFSSS